MHAESVMTPWSRCLATDKQIVDETPRIRLRSGNRPGVADRLSRLVTLRAIEQQRHRLLMLHAGAVCHGDRAVAFVAASGGGKTTATRTLATRYGYLTDETTAVDADFRVLPFPKPLSVLQPTGQWKQQLSPDAAGLARPTHPHPTLRRLVVLDRRDDIDQPQLSRLDLAQAMPVLGPQISYLSALPRPLHRLVALIQQCGGVLRVSYSEAVDLIDVVEELFDTAPAPGTPDVAAPSPRADSSTTEPIAAPGSYARAAVTDQLAIDDRVAVLVDNRLLILDGVGAATWRALGHCADAASIVDAVTEELGQPGGDLDPAVVVDSALAQLRSSGLVVGAHA